MIIVEPFGGLGNRMRAIDSAACVAEASGRELRVIWTQDRELNCPFRRLFELNGDSLSVRNVDLSRKLEWIRYQIVHRAWRRIQRPYCDVDNYRLQREGFDFRGRGERAIYYRICEPFMKNARPFSIFMPTPELRARIESLQRPHQIGVHIRRTDNVRAITRSPTEHFVRLMQEEIRQRPVTSFFLATDSPEEERLLFARFPGRVQTYAKRTLDRNVPEASEDALVDLYVLAGCDRIIGSFWSSFTNVASAIRGAPLIVVDAEESTGN